MEEITVDGDERRQEAQAYQIKFIWTFRATMIDKSEVISNRLHISGLTPAISFDDLSRCFGSFGSVTTLDGLGQLDTLGQPRKFACHPPPYYKISIV